MLQLSEASGGRTHHVRTLSLGIAQWVGGGSALKAELAPAETTRWQSDRCGSEPAWPSHWRMLCFVPVASPLAHSVAESVMLMCGCLC